VPGTFGFIGNGEASLPLHNSGFDFNDEALPFGMHYHVALARQRLPVS
jgi:metal-dependent amidase/aminoacylase/carboxypeptidase family protein